MREAQQYWFWFGLDAGFIIAYVIYRLTFDVLEPEPRDQVNITPTTEPARPVFYDREQIGWLNH